MTPRKLIYSLQDATDVDSDFSGRKPRRFRSPCSRNFDMKPKPHQDCFLHDSVHEVKGNGNSSTAGEKSRCVSESVSSTDEAPLDADAQIHHKMQVDCLLSCSDLLTLSRNSMGDPSVSCTLNIDMQITSLYASLYTTICMWFCKYIVL